MWYTYINKWEIIDGIVRHFYNIRYAESDDGIHWRRNLATAVGFADESENVVAKPCVLFENGIYKMWYSYRRLDSKYTIGYAESPDGIQWTRKDDRIRFPKNSSDAWDGDMQEYPFIHDFEEGGSRKCFYNGNDYGRTGIGVVDLI